ncbi:MAG: MFS transporter [Gemmatimonadetes bacterium]|nr:MFS transporter [Gemmatimonadota bacterium]
MTGAHEARQRIRAIFGGSVGNLVEWYDWYTYSAFALYFAGAFFPPASATAQLLNSAAVFAVGFFMRPVGGWLLGRYADRHGRRAALMASVTLMCGGSLLIAVTPGYATIGLAAPALLLVARLLQGISVGGEYGASATYLSERAGRMRRGFYSSFQYVTLIMGQLLALAVLLVLQATLTDAQLHEWGWRVPFVIGAACAVVAVWLRKSLDETESFRVAQARVAPGPGAPGGAPTGAPASDPFAPGGGPPHASPGATIRGLMQHPRAVAAVFGLTAGGALAFYVFTTYAQKFLVNTTGLSKGVASQVNAATLVVFMLVQPLFGALSDRIGRRPILIAFGLLGTLGTVPLLTTLETAASPVTAFLLLTAALLVVSCYTSINAVVKAELFPTEVRALGVALPYAIAVSLFGGTAEYVALSLKELGHERWFYWYATAIIACSLVVYAVMPDTRAHSKIAED